MLPLSVTIITKNEEKNIGRCIDSVKEVADEIIVLDSFSTDRTIEIAMDKGATVRQEKFRGYIEQKNFAMQLASYDYILSLDADEALSPQLARSILNVKKNCSGFAFNMNRSAIFCGKTIRHGSWYPDKKLRLFNRQIAKWGGINPHDKVLLTQKSTIKHLKGDILHYSYNNIADCERKRKYLTSIYAESMFKAGRRTSLFHIVVNPVWDFFHGYFLRLGFLDGYYGLLISIEIARSVFVKHLKLYHLQKADMALAK
jgi:glycosyltransferase involved in cell wall biosynthesis